MNNEQTVYNETVRILKEAKDLSHNFNQHMKVKEDFEEEFLKKYKNKEIILITQSGEINGLLDDINKYRIEIKINNNIKYFNKSTLIGFYAKI